VPPEKWLAEVDYYTQYTITRRSPQVKSRRADIHAKIHGIPQLRFDPEGRLTSFAGLVVFQALFARLDLKARLRECFSHLRKHSVYGLHALVLLLLVHFLLGFRRLRGLDYYRDDPLVARVLGLRKLPDVATLSRGLKNADIESVVNMRQLIRQIVLGRLDEEQLARITADFDGSVQSTTGHAEGTAIGFNKKKKGARSYYPLFCTIAQTDQFFDFLHRSGNVHDSNGAPSFMGDCLRRLHQRVPIAQLESRIDSAFFNDDVFPTLEKYHVEFSCSVPFERFPELKKLVEKRKRWRHIDSTWSYFETEWKPKCWTDTYRCIFVRQLKAVRQKGPLQLDLFEPKDFEYDYRVIATNKAQSANNVIRFHHGRGSQEKLLGEAKQHVALDLVPTRRKIGNQLYTLAGMLAHNLSRELQMVGSPPAHSTRRKRPALWDFLSLGTLRQRLLHRAGALVRPQGRLTLAINANPTVEKEMLHYIAACDEPR
jgi:hypothetical protein